VCGVWQTKKRRKFACKIAFYKVEKLFKKIFSIEIFVTKRKQRDYHALEFSRRHVKTSVQDADGMRKSKSM
jgi:hypothetical protein